MKKPILLASFLFTICQVQAQCGPTPNVVEFTFDGHDYELIQETLSWEDAAACAVSRGGYLAEINSQQEHDSVYQWLSTDPSITPSGTIDVFGASSIWLGGTDKNTEGDWMWDGNDDGTGVSFWLGQSNGTPVNGAFSAWGVTPPEPDNSGGSQNYLTWRLTGNNTSLWNDLHAPSSLYFLIEKDMSSASISPLEYDPITVYPVPSSDETNLTSSSNELIKKVEIVNLSGQIIATHSFVNSKNVMLDLSDLGRGQYILQVQFDNDRIIRKTIVH